jgi:hypothetical protein
MSASHTPANAWHPYRETEWVVRDDDYEFEEEVAASGYGDMLFDDERVWDVALFA